MFDRLTRLFWTTVDSVDYTIMDARLRVFDLIYGPEPATPADEIGEARHRGSEALPLTGFGAFMVDPGRSSDSELDRG